jgi:hypothetical protein
MSHAPPPGLLLRHGHDALFNDWRLTRSVSQ